ncbi:MAG: phage baseplate assembly protein V [Pyrinomonadaceae bacterium]
MARSIHKLMLGGGRDQSRDDWMVAVEAIVADTNDPESQHRIKVIIPVIDENRVHNEWVTALVPWVGPAGYGPAHLPTIGTEVVLFGRLGQKHSLFYLSRFNEDFLVPVEFADDSRGLKCDTTYRLLCARLIQVLSQTQVFVRGEQCVDVQGGTAVDVEAPDVRLLGAGAVGVHAQGAKVGFLGAGPIARQSLPGPATDVGSCIALANAMRSLLINFGFAQ